MEAKEKIGAVHVVLLGLTLAFLITLSALSLRGGAAGTEQWSVETERSAPAEEIVPLREPVDINTADAAQLQELVGVGPVLAQAIVDYREAHGPFESVDELLEVSGIGEAKLEGMRSGVTLGEGEKP